MTNITTNQITTKAKVINAIKALGLSLLVTLIIQAIVDECLIAIIESDFALWIKWCEHYDQRFFAVVAILAIVYYFKGLNKIVEKARKENDRLSYHLYDNSNPQ